MPDNINRFPCTINGCLLIQEIRLRISGFCKKRPWRDLSVLHSQPVPLIFYLIEKNGFYREFSAGDAEQIECWFETLYRDNTSTSIEAADAAPQVFSVMMDVPMEDGTHSSGAEQS